MADEELTLRDRLHEWFHVGSQETWACGGDVDHCSLVQSAVEPMTRLIADWLDDQGLAMTQKGTVLDSTDFDALAAEAEVGYDVVDGRLIAKQPAVVGRERRAAETHRVPTGEPRRPDPSGPHD